MMHGIAFELWMLSYLVGDHISIVKLLFNNFMRKCKNRNVGAFKNFPHNFAKHWTSKQTSFMIFS